MVFIMSLIYKIKDKKKELEIEYLENEKKEVVKELKDLGRDMIVIQYGFSMKNEFDGFKEQINKVKCPYCNHIFNQKISSGCFNNIKEPFMCPKCFYPENLYNKHSYILKKLRELRKEDD